MCIYVYTIIYIYITCIYVSIYTVRIHKTCIELREPTNAEELVFSRFDTGAVMTWLDWDSRRRRQPQVADVSADCWAIAPGVKPCASWQPRPGTRDFLQRVTWGFPWGYPNSWMVYKGKSQKWMTGGSPMTSWKHPHGRLRFLREAARNRPAAACLATLWPGSFETVGAGELFAYTWRSIPLGNCIRTGDHNL